MHIAFAADHTTLDRNPQVRRPEVMSALRPDGDAIEDLGTRSTGARVVGAELATRLVRAFLDVRFDGEGRHARRLATRQAVEQRFCGSPTPSCHT